MRRGRYKGGSTRRFGANMGRDLRPLDPDTRSDFSRALVNIDMILTAVADESVDAYWSAVRVAGEASNHVVDELLACDLYQMWVELSDLYEFTEEGSTSENDVVLVMRQAHASVAGSAEERSIRAPGTTSTTGRPHATSCSGETASAGHSSAASMHRAGFAGRVHSCRSGANHDLRVASRAIWRAVRRRTWGC